jgi:hypothetical protein
MLKKFGTASEAASAIGISVSTVNAIRSGRRQWVHVSVYEKIKNAKPCVSSRDAGLARELLLGMGSIANASRLTGLHPNGVWKIRSGKTKTIWPKTERKIFEAMAA